MSRKTEGRKSKTMREVKVIQFDFIRDDSEKAAIRTNEVRNLIVQLIEFSHKRGRPVKEEKEFKDAA